MQFSCVPVSRAQVAEGVSESVIVTSHIAPSIWPMYSLRPTHSSLGPLELPGLILLLTIHRTFMTTPRFTHCCSQRTIVDKCRMCSRTIQQEFGSNCHSREQQDFSNQCCLNGGRCCSLALSFVTWMRSGLLLARQSSKSIGSSCPNTVRPRLARMPSCGSLSVPGFVSTMLADWVPPCTELTVSAVSMKLLSVASSPLSLHSSRTARHCGQQTKYHKLPIFQRWSPHSCMAQMSIIVRFLTDGSSYTRCWRWLALRGPHAVQHYPQVFCVAHDLSPVIVQHSSRSRC